MLLKNQCRSRCTTGVNDTGGKWKKSSSRKILIILFGHLFVCLQVHFKVSSARYCPHYLPPVSTSPVANLPPASLIPVASCHRHRWHRRQICRRYRWHWWQICHRCQQHKRNCWQNLTLVSLRMVANLPPVSLIPAAILHLCHWHRWCTLTCEDLREFSKKFEMTLMLFSRAWGKAIHEKTWSKKSRDTVPLKDNVTVIIVLGFPSCQVKKLLRRYFKTFKEPRNRFQGKRLLSWSHDQL